MASRPAWRPLCERLAAAAKQQSPIAKRSFTCSAIQKADTPPSNQDGSTTHFGFQDVPISEKESRVGKVFSSVASEYDRMNDLMSFGIHRLWKDHFVRSLNPGFSPPTSATGSSATDSSSTIGPVPWTILDIAGGTGDIAFRMLDHAHNINHNPRTRVIISDINPSMLREGHARSLRTPYAKSPSLSFLEANAESLSTISSNTIDLYTVAFGIRNFTNKDVALKEAFRVLKPGGVFACLEFSGVTNPVFEAVYKRWSFGAIPLIGQIVAGDRDSYQYLVESIEKFPRQAEWSDMIAEAGFEIPGRGWEDLTGGVAAIHKGVKPLV